MSIFDEISLYQNVRCSCGGSVNEFQTKSLENTLDNYRITKDKQLQIEKCNYRAPKPEEEREVIPGLKLPIMVKESTGWENYNDTNTIFAYTTCPDCGKWIEVQIIIVGGILESLVYNGE